MKGISSEAGRRAQKTTSTGSLCRHFLAAGLIFAGLSLCGLALGAHPDHDQHGESDAHLPPSSANVAFVGKVQLTGVQGGIADVTARGNYAYLAAFRPECGGDPAAQGAGVHVVDISNPSHPSKVGFLPAEPGTYVGEGVHLIGFAGRVILLHNLERCETTTPKVGGFALWDVTEPTAPVKLGQFGDPSPAVPQLTYHTTHSVQGFVWQNRAYAVATDNQDAHDVDIFDITPAIAGSGPGILVWEGGLGNWPEAQAPLAHDDEIFHHDMQQKVIDGRNYLLLSYWDAGQILLNIDDPANPVFVGNSDFPTPDTLTGFAIPQGNSHQSYWSSDNQFILTSDEDFEPTRTLCHRQSGGSATETVCREYDWTVPLATKYPGGFTGSSTIFGGSGCEEDWNGNGVSDRSEIPPKAISGADAVVFLRGNCAESKKVESAELAGYDMVLIGASHGDTGNGLRPDALNTGLASQPPAAAAAAVGIGHRATHLLFNDAPEYTVGNSDDLPAIGTMGHGFSARGDVFDAWGYVRLLNAATLEEIDAYAVSESLDPAFASGFGNLTVHEVKTDPRPGVNRAYLSYYDAGLRIIQFGESGVSEIGHHIAEGGNDFWGVYPLVRSDADREAAKRSFKASQDESRKNCRATYRGNELGACLHEVGRREQVFHQQQTFERGGEPLILMSDRDSGLWIFHYTGS